MSHHIAELFMNFYESFDVMSWLKKLILQVFSVIGVQGRTGMVDRGWQMVDGGL